MKLMKSLLLGSVAGFAAISGAQAADLPSKKAAPVEYVRVCSQFGAGFFYIPGSDTCLKILGRVRADYIYSEPLTRNSQSLTLRARGYLGFDAFTASDWGPVRATTRVFFTRDSGRGFNANGVNQANLANGAATTNSAVDIDWAYIQFAGITAGRLPISFFNFAPMGGVTMLGGDANGRGEDYGSVNALAYTATFGGGFSATLSLEDQTERRRVQLATVGGTFFTAGGLAANPTYGGQVVPDLVGRLDYTAPWGQAVLSGAVHQTRVGSGLAANAAGVVGVNTFGPAATIGDTVYGFAIQGGVKINLPMLAPGDALFLQAAYADGANHYTGWTNGSGVGTIAGQLLAPDVIYDALGSGHTTKTYSITGGLLHYWTPTLSSYVAAAYGKLDAYGTFYDTAALTVIGGLTWEPVKAFVIRSEIGYQRLTETPRVTYTVPANLFGLAKDNWFGRLRFQRDF